MSRNTVVDCHKGLERMEDEEKYTPIFRVSPASPKDKQNGFNYTLEIYWGGSAFEYVPIKHYKSKRLAKEELEAAIDNYQKTEVEK